MFLNLTSFALTFSLLLGAQSDDGKKLVTLRDFSVQGSRFSSVSVVRLAGLHTGKQVNFLLLNDALQKVTSSGLIENIDFEYENYEDKPEEVRLLMKCRDAQPIVPSRVAIDGADEDAIWKWLQNIDPLFTRELPPNEKALHLYETWIGKYFEANGQPDFTQKAAVRAETEGSAGNVRRVVFKRVTLRGVGKKPKR